MKKFLPYNKTLKQFSRDLRNHSTLGEILLWQKLRARTMMGYQFYRQKPLENYIVDFYCQALKLVIEIDGGYHNNDEVYKNDMEREKKLKEWGLNFLRFKETDARIKLGEVVSAIEVYIAEYEVLNPGCMQFKSRRTNPPQSFS